MWYGSIAQFIKMIVIHILEYLDVAKHPGNTRINWIANRIIEEVKE